MKLLIASDLHGSIRATEMLLEQFNKEKAHYLILLGDLINIGEYNPRPDTYGPSQVVHMLNQYADRIIAIRGNSDQESADQCYLFPLFNSMELNLSTRTKLYLHHGHNKIYRYKQGYIYFQGHSHVSEITDCEGYLKVNPGSVALPRSSSLASYMTIEDDTLKLKTLNGQILETVSLFW